MPSCRHEPGRHRLNWIGGTRPGNARFVPPPPDQLIECLGALEKFLHDETFPPLIRAALAPVQFETIHPFLDGNGRVEESTATIASGHPFSEFVILNEVKNPGRQSPAVTLFPSLSF